MCSVAASACAFGPTMLPDCVPARADDVTPFFWRHRHRHPHRALTPRVTHSITPLLTPARVFAVARGAVWLWRLRDGGSCSSGASGCLCLGDRGIRHSAAAFPRGALLRLAFRWVPAPHRQFINRLLTLALVGPARLLAISWESLCLRRKSGDGSSGAAVRLYLHAPGT
ncbi:hypothetical protein E2C01_002810 [Portunus trituberculatus]|uniref:Uncharacterized protein n=1 Tax=Portunus trituberculatus TaxID=210409 RepID=A0A5B7CMX2_PORTR|nr:hypothetical protein [Portunus trituberculatus]